MENNPNLELIDEENPEWTLEMLGSAKTVAQLLINNQSEDYLDYLHIQKVKQ